MENRNNHHPGGGNGFLLGVIIGTIGALLFTTKKGREILREVSEKGIEKFSDLEEVLEREEKTYEELGADSMDNEGAGEEDQEPAEVPKRLVEVKKEEAETIHRKMSPVRKFFKSKRS